MIDVGGLSLYLGEKYDHVLLKETRKRLAPPTTSIYDAPLYKTRSLTHLERNLKVFDHWNGNGGWKKSGSRDALKKHLSMMKSGLSSWPEESVVLD